MELVVKARLSFVFMVLYEVAVYQLLSGGLNVIKLKMTRR